MERWILDVKKGKRKKKKPDKKLRRKARKVLIHSISIQFIQCGKEELNSKAYTTLKMRKNVNDKKKFQFLFCSEANDES
jgi:hypothetical protein